MGLLIVGGRILNVNNKEKMKILKIITIVLAALFFAMGVTMGNVRGACRGYSDRVRVTPYGDITIGGVVYKPGTEPAIKSSIASSRKVVVYFTADWCVYCKVFQKAVLSRPDVAQAISGADRYLVDLTDRNDSRWGYVKKLGGVGIPFFVIYNKGVLTVSTDPNVIICALNA